MRRALLLAAPIAVFLLVLMAGTGLAAATILLGNDSVASLPDSDAAGLAEAFNFSASASGGARSISVYVDSGSSASGLAVGLYADNSGHPGSLLASGSGSRVAAGRWNEVTLDSTPTLSSGTSYWLAVLGTGGQLNFRDADLGTGGCSETSAQGNLTTLPSSWNSGVSWPTCLLSAHVAGVASSATTPVPANTALPTINGEAVQGQTLTASNGSWSGSPTGYAYQWQDCDGSGGNCTDVSGATSSSYTLASGDVGDTMRAVVTASNSGGSTSATSAQTAAVTAAAPSPPSNTGLPVVSGSTVQGQALTTSNGTWSGSPTGYAYQWQDCDGSGGNCTDVSGATSSSYTLASGDVGDTMRAVVTASNSGGSTSATSTQTATVTGSAGGGGITFQPIDGGPNYFANISSKSAWTDGHILLGGWLQQPLNPTEVGYDALIGNNIYWNLAASPGNNRVDYNVIRSGGMHASAPETDANTGFETVLRDGNDESDMNFGPGWNGWDGSGYSSSDCQPSGSQCGYTVDSQFYNSINHAYAVHQGYGKGVLFWESDSQAAQFMKFSDVESADSYWLTDQDLESPSQGGCALLPSSSTACSGGNATGLTQSQSMLPANYAYNVSRLEQLDKQNGASKPVVVDVETGCPMTNDNAGHCVTVPQFQAAAWHAMIAGARGIIWFQHSFSGPCVDFNTFYDGLDSTNGNYNCQITPGETLHDLVLGVTAFDQEMAHFNSVLLSPTATNYVTSTTGDVSTLAKADGKGGYVVFAGSGKPATPPAANQQVTFTLHDSYTGPVIVYGESRTVQASNGVFTDRFADGNTVHIYQVL